MDYEKKYKEAVKAIKELSDSFDDDNLTNELGIIFPELKESEGERIRKHLIKHFGNKSKTAWNGMPVDKIIAWLEKQGQTFTKKDIDDAYLKGVCDAKRELEKQGEQKPACAWSEEDEENIDTISKALIRYISYDGITQGEEWRLNSWLKSLKDRYAWKPSDEQMAALQNAIGFVGELTTRGCCLKELKAQLEKLREE